MQTLMRGTNNFTGGNSNEVNLAVNSQRNLLTAAGNPSYMETRRRGDGWSVQLTTAPTALIAVPTTLAHLEIYNNGTRLIVVSDLHMYRLLATAVATGDTCWAQITTQKAVPVLTALATHSMSGKSLITPTATSEVVTGVGTTIITNGWRPYGSPSAYLGAATPGTGQNIPIDGKLIVPPGCSLCLSGSSNVNTSTAIYLGVTYDLVAATVEA